MTFPLALEQLSPLVISHDPFLLFDSACPVAGDRFSYLLIEPVATLCANTADELKELLNLIDQRSGQLWIAGYMSYEAAYCLEERLAPLRSRSFSSPLAWFGLFDHVYLFDHESGAWSRPLPETIAYRELDEADAKIRYRPHLDQASYHSKVDSIRNLISQGETYQVNLTFGGSLSTALDSFELYRRLRTEQRARFAAYIHHGGHFTLSFSPELFFQVRQRTITVKPMKGTAARGRTVSEDRRLQEALADDSKNRSENLMIVDLLRSDLGKICETGSIKVDDLFAVESHRTLLQMTSTIKGRLRSDANLSEVLKALFPSGSVTGAPKIRSMEIIAELEDEPRGPYCGAIGLSSPHGDSVFSVPIRTMFRNEGNACWQFPVGSGIVWDSDPAAEWQECLTKSAFLTANGGSFEILETMLLFDGEILFEEAHRQRMADSAHYWAYPFSDQQWHQAISELIQQWCRSEPARIRLLLDENGRMHGEVLRLDPEPWPELPAPVHLARLPVDETSPFLFHKTTHRPWYQSAMDAIRQGKLFDTVFINSKAEVTEGARSNVFVLDRGTLLTPPVDCGLLPGTLRAELIRTGVCHEQVLSIDDLLQAEHVYCGSSVQGLVPVRLIPYKSTDQWSKSFHGTKQSIEAVNQLLEQVFGQCTKVSDLLLEQGMPLPKIDELKHRHLDIVVPAICDSLAQYLRDVLPEAHALVIGRRYCLANPKIATLKELGDILGVSRQRVHQLQEKGLKRLKSAKRRAAIKSLIHTTALSALEPGSDIRLGK
jgi:para-aminobenzoate synthetase/4-amino-4-deoxychorismate lyase